MKNNPIPFAPDTMTVKQVKQCAQVLREIFDAIERDVDSDNIVFHLKQHRDQMLREWGAQP